MSDQQGEGQDIDNGSDADEAARYAEMEAGLEGDQQEGEEGDEGGEEEKPVRSRLSPEELERRVEQKSVALKHERRRARELEARLAELERRSEPQQQTKAQPEWEIPDPVDDPIGAIAAIRALEAQRLQDQQRQSEQSAQEQAQQRQFSQIAGRMADYENDFREMTPDYDKAVDHFRAERESELKEQGYDGPELNRALTTEFLGLVTRALHAGKDPAEVVYTLAKKRGYGIDKGVNKLQGLQKAQSATSPLNRAGGKQGDAPRLTVADVSKLKGAALLEGYSKLRAQERGR